MRIVFLGREMLSPWYILISIFNIGVCIGQFVPKSGPPVPVHRASITVVANKQVRPINFRPDPQVLDVYDFRARWAPPAFWNDDHNSQEIEGRSYDLQCWLEQNGAFMRTLVDIHMKADFNTYGEKYQFPPDADLVLACKVRANNALGFSSNYALTNRIRLLDVTISAPGAEGLNLRGLNNQDIINTWRNIDAQVQAENPSG